jgi:hypothetical protein
MAGHMGERFKYFEQLTMVARFVVQPQVSVQPVAVNGPRGRAVSVHHDQCHHGDIIRSNVQRRAFSLAPRLRRQLWPQRSRRWPAIRAS